MYDFDKKKKLSIIENKVTIRPLYNSTSPQI
jgi:hypothetical protein